jgi:ubiquinone/menaquinone biosynthesis C-methylase UbiE
MNNIWLSDEFTSRYSTAEGITGPPASALIKQAGLEGYSGSEELNIVDHACGTGIVSELLWNALGEEGRKNAILTCGDISEGMLSQMKERMVKVGWGDKGKVINSDLKNTGLPSDHFTHVIINMGVQALPNTEEALAGMCLLHRLQDI